MSVAHGQGFAQFEFPVDLESPSLGGEFRSVGGLSLRSQGVASEGLAVRVSVDPESSLSSSISSPLQAVG